MKSLTFSIRLCLAVLLLVVTAVEADEIANIALVEEHVDPSENKTITLEDEMIVRGKRDRLPPPMMMLDIYDANTRGGYFYRLRNYERAFPYLLRAAKAGFKESQARVAFIYQQGLGGVDRNWIEAVGWMGAAASPNTRPEIRNYYKSMRFKMETAHPDHMEAIDDIVETYVQKYGSNATGVSCDMVRPAGSHIAKMRCGFDEEYKYRDESGLYDVSTPESIGGSNTAPSGF